MAQIGHLPVFVGIWGAHRFRPHHSMCLMSVEVPGLNDELTGNGYEAAFIVTRVSNICVHIKSQCSAKEEYDKAKRANC